MQRTFYCQYGKRILDVIVALILLALFLPLMLIVGILIFLSMGRPVLFCQKRPGFKGKIFTIYKFRTMSNKADQNGKLLEDKDRLTPIGKIIRRLSLDEFPQLINILKGEMSLVGPRPLLIQYLPLYNAHQKRRHDIKPGITGWAQIHGRNQLSWEQRFDMDVWYVEHCNFIIDFQIVIKSIVKSLKQEGISSKSSATMELFKGSKE